MAVGANIVVYFAPDTTEQSVVNALSQAVHDSTNAPSIVTYSWFSSEDSWNASARTSVANTLNDAAALGVTVFFITGDDGSDDDVGDGFAHVAYPASEFGCVACGGTYISNVSGSSFDEGTWNDVGATGGGVSDVYGLPSWQDNIGVPKSANNGTTVGRGVPDVSGNASAFSGYDLILYGESTSRLKYTSGSLKGLIVGPSGGTSAVAPLYAALLALIEAKIGGPLGYLTPLLYTMQGGGQFVDINDGANNQWSGEKVPAPHYTCGLGWDACTGLGRIDGAKLLSGIASQVYRTAMPLAAGNDSSGLLDVIVLNPNDTNQPYLITQNSDGSWQRAVAMPNPSRRLYSAITATVSVTNQLLVLLLDGQPRVGHGGLPYVTQIVPGETLQAPDPITFSNGSLIKGFTYLSLATGGDTSSNILLVLLINFHDYLTPPSEGQTYDNVTVLSQSPDGDWQILGNLSDLTGLNESTWGITKYTGSMLYAASTTGVGNGLLHIVLLEYGKNNAVPIVLTESERDTWTASVLPMNYPGGFPFASLFGYPQTVATGKGNAGYLQVVVLGADGAYLLWLDNTGKWNIGIQTYQPENSTQQTLPNPEHLVFTAVAMGTGNNANKLQVILLAEDGLPYLIWQDTNGVWNWFGKLPMGRLNQGVIFTAVTTGIGNGTRLQVLLLGSDGHLYLIWQDVTGAWVPHQDATNAMIPLL